MPATRIAPARIAIPKSLPRVYCARCRHDCIPHLVAVTGENAATRSRLKWTCTYKRCGRKNVVVHRSPSFDNQTGY